ncbi:MAG: ParB/RepB/Spo0J family partition protein [Anaplasmataceae bacterium]|nr:ParB/RepB/Spo0J family partition protein [Anaplasmataceae bacterium]
MLGKGLDALIPSSSSQPGDPAQGEPLLPPSDVHGPVKPEELTPTVSSASLPNQTPPVVDPVAPSTNTPPSQEELGESIPVSTSPDKDWAPPPKKAQMSEAVFLIEVEKIKPNPHQPRRTFDENALKELAQSIREHGILQPLVATKIEKETAGGTDVEYQLIAGERRFLASKMIGLERVPVIVRTLSPDKPNQSLEIAIIENLQREDLNSIEMARAFARLQDEFRMTQREIATRLGKSRETVANTLRLLDLPHEMQEAIIKGQITESHGRLLLTIKDPALQDRLFRDLLENSITTRELHQRVRKEVKSKEVVRGNTMAPEIMMLEEKLSSTLGAPVRINQIGQSGKITINFYSPEELKNILNHLENLANQEGA